MALIARKVVAAVGQNIKVFSSSSFLSFSRSLLPLSFQQMYNWVSSFTEFPIQNFLYSPLFRMNELLHSFIFLLFSLYTHSHFLFSSLPFFNTLLFSNPFLYSLLFTLEQHKGIMMQVVVMKKVVDSLLAFYVLLSSSFFLPLSLLLYFLYSKNWLRLKSNKSHEFCVAW